MTAVRNLLLFSLLLGLLYPACAVKAIEEEENGRTSDIDEETRLLLKFKDVLQKQLEENYSERGDDDDGETGNHENDVIEEKEKVEEDVNEKAGAEKQNVEKVEKSVQTEKQDDQVAEDDKEDETIEENPQTRKNVDFVDQLSLLEREEPAWLNANIETDKNGNKEDNLNDDEEKKDNKKEEMNDDEKVDNKKDKISVNEAKEDDKKDKMSVKDEKEDDNAKADAPKKNGEKTYHFEKIAPKENIILNGKKINKEMGEQEEQAVEKEAKEYLHGQTLEERMKVWEALADVERAMDIAKNLPVADLKVEEDDLFENDIVLNVDQAKEIAEEVLNNMRRKRSIRSTDNEDLKELLRELDEKEAKKPLDVQTRKMHVGKSKWTFPIKYTFDSTLSASARNSINAGVQHWQQQTCIRFQYDSRSNIPGPNMKFTKGSGGCSSPVGRQNSENLIKIGTGCTSLATTSHEIGHSLGFWHEQSRPDRDSYVNIISGNIRSGKQHNFAKYGWSNIVSLAIPYDLSSEMHYSPTAFSKNGGNTITSDDSTLQKVMGVSDPPSGGLSFYDAKLANFYYCNSACPGYSTLKWSSCRNDGYRDPKSCSKCRCPDGWTGTWCTSVMSNTAACGTSYLGASTSWKSLYSPGYLSPGYYTTPRECSYRITAPFNHEVKAYFRSPFYISCGSTVCSQAYVEVRYKRLDQTGPRYCCGTRPTTTFVSHGRYMMILFRASAPGPASTTNKGFHLRYVAVKCGGCTATSAATVSACKSTVPYSCRGRYTVKCGLFGWKRCARYRDNTCYKTNYSCCTGFSRIGSVCRFNGCGGCVNKSVTSQPACRRKESYRQRYTTKCGFLGWKRCNRYRTAYRMGSNYCCSGFHLSGSNCIKN